MIDLLEIKPNIIDPSLNGKIFWFYGEPGTRKTSVAAKFENSLLIATEKGYKFINGVMPADVENWNDIKRIYFQLKNEEVRKKFSNVIFDRIDTAYEYCKDYVLKQLGVSDPSEVPFGGAWGKIKKEFNFIIKGIENLGYGIIFISHDKAPMKDTSTTVQDIENTAAKVIRGYSDFIFLVKKENIEGNETVVAYSQKAGVESKSRARYFTNTFEFTFDNLKDEMKKAIDKQIAMEGIEVQIQERKEVEHRSFEEIRNSVIALFTHLQEIEFAGLSDVASVVNIQMQGVRISEANETYYDRMMVLETYLMSVEEQYK